MKQRLEKQELELVEALVDCPGAQGLYTYEIPAGWTVTAGDILSVPFGYQQVGAIAIRKRTNQKCQSAKSAGAKSVSAKSVSAKSVSAKSFSESDDLNERENFETKPIESVVCSGLFPKNYWLFLEKIADYYCSSLIAVVKTALPPKLLSKGQRRIKLKKQGDRPKEETPLTSSAIKLLEWWESNSPNKSYSFRYLSQRFPGADCGLKDLLQKNVAEGYLAAPKTVKAKRKQAVTLISDSLRADDLTLRQREILGVLQRRGGDLWLQSLVELARTSNGTVRSLEKKGYVAIEDRELLRTERGQDRGRDLPKALTVDQEKALAVIRAMKPGETALLHGVTGSGKTEVYLQGIAPLLLLGKSALVLVPEIGLTPQLVDRFRSRFGDRVCVYHSGLSDGERYDTWRQMLQDKPQVIIGTRSAVFSPLKNLGMIILDEEHDSSFKQDQPSPCYHARTLAEWRSQLDQCPLILGSATPALETWVKHNLPKELDENISKRYYLSLPNRINNQPLPPISVVDMREELKDGHRSIFSRQLLEALENLKRDNQQGILFIHRRGHSTFVSCRSCGKVLECPHCDVSLSYHHVHEDARKILRCHFCNYGQLHPPKCPDCGSPYLKHFGSGTQRVVRSLQAELPHLKMLRYDSDTTRTKNAHRHLIDRFSRGEADVLVGTQMLAKGIDLPQVTLVGIVSADGLLHFSDYRAGERAVQTLTQVSGRAGRGDYSGQVILQTYTPDDPAVQAVKNYRYADFLTEELNQREALNYPPKGRMILLRFSSPNPDAVEKSASNIAKSLTEISESQEGDRWEVLGPAPAQVMRVARRFRWQVLLKLPPNSSTPNVLRSLHNHCPSSVKLTIDVDPLNLL
ncbi:MAG: primosomal protein N' [Cyanophyceae cyanobacterium]